MSIKTKETSPITIQFPVNPQTIEATLNFIQTLSSSWGVEKPEQNRIRLALEELLLFLLNTSLSDPGADPLKIEFNLEPDAIRFLLHVKGLPLDLEKLPIFSSDVNDLEGDPEALNLFLAKHMMDKVTFTNKGKEGILIQMEKKRFELHVKNRMEKEEKLETVIVSTEQKPLDFIIRQPKKSEAIGISKAAYLSYGYTYIDFIYYPEKIIQMQEQGQLHSLIVVKDDGEIIGHAAVKLNQNNVNMGEQSMLFVIPEYRKNYGIAPLLAKEIFDLAKKLGLSSTYTHALTIHPKSQILFHKLGGHDFGILLGYLPKKTDLKGFDFEKTPKMSAVIQWASLKEQRLRRFFTPPEYDEIIKGLYQEANIPFAIERSSQKAPKKGEPYYLVNRIDSLNIANIEIVKMGNDPEKTAKTCLHTTNTFKRQKIDAVYVYLPAEKKGCSTIARILRKEGFIFAGMFPDYFSDSDAFILQSLSLDEDPFNLMQLASDNALKLKELLHKEWNAIF